MKGSYQFENLESRQREATYLSQRAHMRLEGFPELLKRHGYPPQGKILEVGCGQGMRSKIMAECFPESHILGIDRSPELLAEAQEIFSSDHDQTREKQTQYSNLEFNQADLYQLPYDDECFDFIYARLVFMHLHRPERALKSLLRVLKKGGKILIEDADRDCMFFEPAPESFSLFWDKVQEGQRRLGGDPNVGRKLATYMKINQLQKIKIEVQPIIGGGPEISFLVETLLPSLNYYLNSEDRSLGNKAIFDLQQLSLDPSATFYHFWFVISGEK